MHLPPPKWVEVCPLRRHDASSVATAFASMCTRWGAPDVVRTDNGTEFNNAIMESLYSLLGVRVRTGAARHPESQGSAERVNRTILGLIRKTLDDSSDWVTDLDVLLFFYRNRPHHVTHLSPSEAMFGWVAQPLVVKQPSEAFTMSVWGTRLARRVSAIRDLIEANLSTHDFVDNPSEVCKYSVGDLVMLRQPERRQKRQPPYETGWRVVKVVSPSTVIIEKAGQRTRQKTVNVALLKIDKGRSSDRELSMQQESEATAEEDQSSVQWMLPAEAAHPPATPSGPYSLRDRATISQPARYGD